MKYLMEPTKSVNLGLNYARELRDTDGIPFGVPEVDAKLLPLRPGWLEFIIARPGDGKTSLLSWRANSAINYLRENEVVLFFSWEQFREEVEFNLLIANSGQTVSDIYWGTADVEAIAKTTAKERSLKPIWVVAQSRYDSKRHDAPMMIDDVFAICRGLEDEMKLKPGLILIDYLQYIPVASGRSRTEEIAENVHGLKQLAIDLHCPISVAAQATKQKGAKFATRIPGMGDAFYSREVEMDAYRLMGSVRPRHYIDDDHAMIKFGGEQYPVDPFLFLLGMSKQRGEESMAEFALYFDISTMTMRSWNPWPIGDFKGRAQQPPKVQQPPETPQYQDNGNLW